MADAYLKVKDNGVQGLALVREESDVSVSDLKNAFGLIDLSSQTWARGRIGASGQNVSSTTNIYTSNFIPVTGGDLLFAAFGFPAAYGNAILRVAQYSTDSTSGYISTITTNSKSPKFLTLDSTATYIRMELRTDPAIEVALSDYQYVSVLTGNSVAMRLVGSGVNNGKYESVPNAVSALNADVAPEITKSGTTYTITITGYPRTYWTGGSFISTDRTNVTLTLASPELLYYDLDSDTYVTNLSGVNRYVTLLANINGILFGPWSKYYTDAVLDGKVDSKCVNGIVGFAGKDPIITRSGRTFTVALNGYARAAWNSGVKLSTLNRNNDTYTFNANTTKYFVYYPNSDTFAVLDDPSYPAEDKFILLLLASYGTIFGQWAKYYVQNEPDKSEYPEYYDAQLTAKSAIIRKNALSVGRHGGRFVFVTDYHIEQNARHTGPLVKALMQDTGIRMMVHGGDAIQSETTVEKGMEKLVEYTKDFSNVMSIARIYSVIGNHEENNPSANPDYANRMIPTGTVYQLLTSDSSYKIHPLWSGGPNDYYYSVNSYFMDDDRARVRYYFVGCDYKANLSGKDVRAMAQSFGEIPSGYAVIILSHLGIKWDSTEQTSVIQSTRVDNMLECAAALNDGTSVTIEYTESFSESYDYTGKARKFLGVISGHCHYDDYVMYDGRFPVIATTTDAVNGSVPSTHHVQTRTEGTVTEQAFDAVQIDADSWLIAMTRIGAGNDRIFHCTPTSESSYTTTISSPVWASSDSSIATVANGAVTAVSSGYAVISATSAADGITEYWVYQAVV